jgi:hypothetical protein
VGTPALLRAGRPPKWLLREAWGHVLEPDSLARGKSGFTVDVAAWLRTRGAPLVAHARAALAARRLFDRAALDAAFAAWTRRLPTGHAAAWGPLYALIQLNAQLERWGEP